MGGWPGERDGTGFENRSFASFGPDTQINRAFTLLQRSVRWDTTMISGEAYDEVTKAALEKWDCLKAAHFCRKTGSEAKDPTL